MKLSDYKRMCLQLYDRPRIMSNGKPNPEHAKEVRKRYVEFEAIRRRTSAVEFQEDL